MKPTVTDIELAIEYAQAGNNPTTISRVRSGWVFLALNQVLRGCCLLVADPVTSSIEDLDDTRRQQFIDDMLLTGKAIKKVTGAARINYLVLGNKDPVLHVHIIPRFSDEPDEYKSHGPWKYENYVKFDTERDTPLIEQLRVEIEQEM